MRSGAVDALAIEAGRDCDYKTPLQAAALTPGSLRITDLGYFDTEVFQHLGRRGAFWLSRLQFGTSVFDPAGRRLPLLDWLAATAGAVRRSADPDGDRAQGGLPGRRLAASPRRWPTGGVRSSSPRRVARTAACRAEERLAWCDWTILVTNVPADLLTATEAAVLYRARWQIELLFKRWKSLGLIAELTGSTEVRQMVRLWSRLLAVLVQHWLLLASAWGDPAPQPGQGLRGDPPP